LLRFRKKCLNTLPLFFSFIGFCVLETVAGVSIRTVAVYNWYLVFTVLASSALELAVIYELANKLILSHSSLAGFLGPLPRWTAAVLLLLATVGAALFPEPVRNRMLQGSVTLDFFHNLVNLGLLLAILLVARIVGVSWPSLPAGVALGLGVSAVGNIAGDLRWGVSGRGFVAECFKLGSWHLSVLVFLFFLLTPDRTLKTSEASLQVLELTPHPQELQRLLRR
jgi:hypothetical protein